ncbi:MAG TPA: hypothetical protein VG755_36985 [Nannocystaceae bacterium]|nr:hypothetical protein [Nannocystaceae bacterium]
MLGGAAGSLAMVLAWASVAAPPEPEEGTVALQWRAPEGCPDGVRVRDEIRRFVATGAQTGTLDRVDADARVVREGDRYVLELELKLPGGAMHKRIEADKCEVLASAAALVMAVMLDPKAVVETVEEAKVEPPTPEPPPKVEPKPVTPPPPVDRKRRVQALMRIFGMGSFGAMPRFGGALGGSLGARIGRARVEVVALGEIPQRKLNDTERSAGARIDLWTLGVRGCFAPNVNRVEFPLCAGVEAGQLRARGFGLSVARSTAAPWLAFPFGAMVMWAPVPRFAFGGGVDAWVAATRPTFEIDDLGPIHRTQRAGVRIHASVELRLP